MNSSFDSNVDNLWNQQPVPTILRKYLNIIVLYNECAKKVFMK